MQSRIHFPLFSDGIFNKVREYYAKKEYATIQAENYYLRNVIRGYKGCLRKLKVKVV